MNMFCNCCVRLPRRLLHRCNADLALIDAAMAGSSGSKDMADAMAAAQAAADELLVSLQPW